MNALETPARPISPELGSVLLDTLGLAETIEWHAHRFQKRTGVLCELKVSRAAVFDLPEEHAETIFDICSEALSNVARHARASRVAIALTIKPHEIAVVVSDNGVGLGKQPPALCGGGLSAIRERSQMYNGVCEIASVGNAGTTVAVSLPLPLNSMTPCVPPRTG